MLADKELGTAFIYNPVIDKWGKITETCIVDGKF